MEYDDDSRDYSIPIYDDSYYLSELYQRLTAGVIIMDDQPSYDNSSDNSFFIFDDPDDEIYSHEEYDMSEDEDNDSMSNALSEASTVDNGENQQQSQSGTDTEIEERDEERRGLGEGRQERDEERRGLGEGRQEGVEERRDLGEGRQERVEERQDLGEGRQERVEERRDLGEGRQERVEENNESSEEVFHFQKKIKLDDRVGKKEDPIEDDSTEEDQRCPICLECWNNAGEHRLCSLRCGHLFGLKCITQWFSVTKNATDKKCPECNSKASKKDIRVLYAKNLRCLDTSEIDKLKEQLKNVSSEKERAEFDLAMSKSREVMYEQRLNSLKQRVLDLERKVKYMNSDARTCSFEYDTNNLKKLKVFNFCINKSCRVMAYNPWHRILVASVGNNIGKIYVDTLTTSLNIKVHDGSIRDMAFQERHPNFLLSVGFDRKIMLTDIRSNLLIHSYIEENNLWSCCWSNYNTQTFFVGDARGNVIEYDIRYLNAEVSTKQNARDRSPVVSLASVPTSSRAIRAGGYLACQLNSCWAYGFKEGNYVGNQIDIEGPFTSLRYNENDNHVLISCRASARNPFVRQLVCSIEKTEEKYKFNTLHTFNAGTSQKLLSRPCFMNLKTDTVVLANNENVNSISAWSISTGQEVYTLPISDPVVDVCSFDNNGAFQAILTSDKIHLYSYKEKIQDFDND